LYGEDERHPTVCIDPARDDFELELAREAIRRDLPILAICRGVQVLNVAAGGTLFQDLPAQHPSGLNHSVKTPVDRVVHEVSVLPGSRLAEIVSPGADASLQVNSRHHQAVRTVAPGFVASATAPDGIIEAIERPGASFCLGVQWHPENFWRTGEFSALFDGFTAAARQRRLKP
jgi:putative glutamine amidotransferase